MTTIDIMNKLNLSDEKKLKLLALYIDTLALGLEDEAAAELRDFIHEVLNTHKRTPDEPGIPADDDIKARYDQLLEPLEDLGSLGAVPPDAHSLPGFVHLIPIPFPRKQQEEWIDIMRTVDDSELPPPGTTIFSIPLAPVAGVVAVGLNLVSAEGGPFIDAYLQNDEDIICEHKPIRDTEFLESRTNINMQHGEHTYEFEITPT